MIPSRQSPRPLEHVDDAAEMVAASDGKVHGLHVVPEVFVESFQRGVEVGGAPRKGALDVARAEHQMLQSQHIERAMLRIEEELGEATVFAGKELFSR